MSKGSISNDSYWYSLIWSKYSTYRTIRALHILLIQLSGSVWFGSSQVWLAVAHSQLGPITIDSVNNYCLLIAIMETQALLIIITIDFIYILLVTLLTVFFYFMSPRYQKAQRSHFETTLDSLTYQSKCRLNKYY